MSSQKGRYNMPSESYMETLRRHREEVKAQRESKPPEPTLAERIDAWWNELPSWEKEQPYTMEFFRKSFGESPARIGPALHSLGWERKRMWRPGQPFSRYWTST